MILSDRDIAIAIGSGRITVEPLDPDDIQPASIDLHLGPFLRTTGKQREWEIPEGGCLIKPGELLLGSTAEYVELPDDITARLEGKSSLGRIGLLTHLTAGFIDPGFRGQVTLELTCIGQRVRLMPGIPIAQLAFMTMTSPALRPYGHPDLGSHYQDQRGPTPARNDG